MIHWHQFYPLPLSDFQSDAKVRNPPGETQENVEDLMEEKVAMSVMHLENSMDTEPLWAAVTWGAEWDMAKHTDMIHNHL